MARNQQASATFMTKTTCIASFLPKKIFLPAAAQHGNVLKKPAMYSFNVDVGYIYRTMKISLPLLVVQQFERFLSLTYRKTALAFVFLQDFIWIQM